ncbi:MAG: NifU family protein [Alphaproteobacteria bacterium]|nr:NifU family protein [Alphaproteobacteria bacterium]
MKIETLNDGDIMHFYPDNGLKMADECAFYDKSDLNPPSLAEGVLGLVGVENILMTFEGVSVSKEKNARWEDIKPFVMTEIADFVEEGKKLNHNQDIKTQIQGVIALKIRPMIQKDGGGIVFKGYNDGIVRVELQGKCVGCPHSQNTLKNGVEKILKTYIKQVKAVEKDEI